MDKDFSSKKLEQMTKRRYDGRFSKNGKSAKSLGWKNRKSQRIRFSNLIELIEGHSLNWKSCSILDFGCGMGDLLNELRRVGFYGKYTGVDLSENFIDIALKKYEKDENSSFIIGGVDSLTELPRHDIATLIGCINYDYGELNNSRYVKKMIDALHAKTKELLLFDFISTIQLDRVSVDSWVKTWMKDEISELFPSRFQLEFYEVHGSIPFREIQCKCVVCDDNIRS